MKIAVLMGGNSPEREVSLNSGAGIVRALQTSGHLIDKIDFTDDLAAQVHRLTRADLVFSALHGGDGENGIIQGFLESIGVCYTGSGTLASAVCMDKDFSKQLVRRAGFATPDWQMVNNVTDAGGIELTGFPLVVKPNDLGSTIGLTIVDGSENLSAALKMAADYTSEIMVENFIAGRELTVSVVDDEVFPVVEIIPTHELYDYECKYTSGMSSYVCPADIPPEITRELQSTAMAIFRLLKCRHYGRIDFRLDENGKFWFLETNTLPGMTATSLVPKAAAAAGYNFNQLIEKIADLALND